MLSFVGRKYELKKLQDLSKQGRASLVVIKGRRRVGKSRLVKEFAKDKIFLPFTGLAPVNRVSAQHQRDTFGRQLAQNFKLPPFTFTDWSDGFVHLSRHLTNKPTVILFDEITWMGAKDPTFIPKLQAWWDLNMQNYPKLMLILCGSISTWIEENIINSTAFFGRISLHLDLGELTLAESCQLLKNAGVKASNYDVYKLLSVTGGIPWYIEQVNYQQSIDENIKKLCFEHRGLLVGEFDRLFHDLFSKRGSIYKKIIHILAEGMKELADIREDLKYSHSGTLSSYLKTLVTSGFVSEHYTWSLKTSKLGRQSLYRLSDNYLRFFVKYIEPNLAKIEKSTYQYMSLNNLPGWEAMMGFQVESLVIKNRHLLLEVLGIHPEDIVADNPYLQRASTRHKGCQIDYLVQTHTKNLFICEFKFSRREINSEIIEQIKNKIKRFSVPKGFGVNPVLIHLGGVSDEVYDKKYFYRIIDINDFLNVFT